MPSRLQTVVRVFAVLMGTTLLAFGVRADDEDEPKSKTPKGGIFEGKWVNRKMGSSGPLRCVLKPSEEGDRSATFDGTFKGEPFKYDVTFTAKTSAAKTDLKGNAVIDGDPYNWQGTLKGDSLNVKYRSVKGYNGDFTLKRGKDDPKKKPKRGNG